MARQVNRLFESHSRHKAGFSELRSYPDRRLFCVGISRAIYNMDFVEVSIESVDLVHHNEFLTANGRPLCARNEGGEVDYENPIFAFAYFYFFSRLRKDSQQ